MTRPLKPEVGIVSKQCRRLPYLETVHFTYRRKNFDCKFKIQCTGKNSGLILYLFPSPGATVVVFVAVVVSFTGLINPLRFEELAFGKNRYFPGILSKIFWVL